MKTVGFYVSFECEDDDLEAASLARYVAERLEFVGMAHDGVELADVRVRDIDEEETA